MASVKASALALAQACADEMELAMWIAQSRLVLSPPALVKACVGARGRGRERTMLGFMAALYWYLLVILT